MNAFTRYTRNLGANIWQFVDRQFWWLVMLVIIAKWLLISDVPFYFPQEPAADGLHVARAFQLLVGDNLGPYDAIVLARPPGMSFFIASSHFLGLRYLFVLHLAYAVALAYLVGGLARAGTRRPGLLLVFIGGLCAPTTFDLHFFSAHDTGPTVVLYLLVGGALCHVFAVLGRGQVPFVAAPLLGGAVAALPLVRPDQGFIAAAAAAVPLALWVAWTRPNVSRRQRLQRGTVQVAVASGLTCAAAFALYHGAHVWVWSRYGQPITNELAEGEFPALVAMIERVAPLPEIRDDRITGAAIGRIAEVSPALVETLAALREPEPPNGSCDGDGHCEWEKDSFFMALRTVAASLGRSPNLATGQRTYRQATAEIARACADGRLTCGPESTLPTLPPSLPLLPFFLQPTIEFREEVAHATVAREVRQAEATLFPGLPLAPLGRTVGEDFDADLRSNLLYWLHNPDVAASEAYGPREGDQGLGARRHYQEHGRREGRSWGEELEPAAEIHPRPVRAQLRRTVYVAGSIFDDLVHLLGGCALFVMLIRVRSTGLGPAAAAILAALGICLARWLTLPRLVTVGWQMAQTSRVFYPAYTLLLIFSLWLIVEAFLPGQRRRLQAEAEQPNAPSTPSP